MNVNDTPRTDAALKDVLQCGYDYKVKADFARQLERELQRSNNALELANDDLEALRNHLITAKAVFLELACFDQDPVLNSRGEQSYDSFDEPHAARRAREALYELRGKSL